MKSSLLVGAHAHDPSAVAGMPHQLSPRCDTGPPGRCCPCLRSCCAGTRPRTPNCWCRGTRTRCCDGTSPVRSTTSPRTVSGRPRCRR
ncbi:hypothetical protein ACR6C2_04585 [Streptomyces sp. INA 01156]